MWVDSSIFLASKGERQQNPASEAWLLPLTLVGFIGSMAEAAKSCFRGVVAAFDLGEFHWIFGRGSKILPPEVVAAFDLGRFHWVFGRGSKKACRKAF